MLRKYSWLFLILFIIGLYVLQSRGIMPFVQKVAESDLFTEKSEEEEELGMVKNERTALAYLHCRAALKDEQDIPEDAEFREDRYDSWALGNRMYIIRSSVLVLDPEKGQLERQFACKMQYAGGDESDAANWSVIGTEYNP